MAQIVGANTHHPRADQLDALVAAAMRIGRIDLNWKDAEPERRGVFVWDWLDRIIDDMTRRGLAIYATLAYTPSWANSGADPYTPPHDVGDWVRFVAAVTERHGPQIHVYSLWNEPNRGHFRGTVRDYVQRIVLPAVPPIRQYAPASRIAAPDLSTEDDWQGWLRTCLQQSGQQIDIVSVHSYDDDGREVLRRLGGPSRRTTLLEVMRQSGCEGKPVMLSETGWSTQRISENIQTRNIDQLLEALPQYPWIEALLIYEIQDGDPEGGYGLLRADGSPKPSYEVVRRRCVGMGAV